MFRFIVHYFRMQMVKLYALLLMQSYWYPTEVLWTSSMCPEIDFPPTRLRLTPFEEKFRHITNMILLNQTTWSLPKVLSSSSTFIQLLQQHSSWPTDRSTSILAPTIFSLFFPPPTCLINYLISLPHLKRKILSFSKELRARDLISDYQQVQRWRVCLGSFL